MIDEYQDTNEIQYNIFLPILDQLKKGNLFVVGDEKQSIYMFRDAELEVFDLTKQNIESASGKDSLLTLPDSFRMAPAICLFTNLLFRKLFANPEVLYNEVAHSDLVCARQDEVPGKIEILITEENGNTGEDETGGDNCSEAELIARRILKLIFDESGNQKLSWKDAAVLCRKRKYFAELEKAFTSRGIPFLILGGKDFYRRQAIYDVYNYFSFLADEKNDASLVGILRSPFFSMPDSTIYEISLQEGSGFWEKLSNYKSGSTELNKTAATLKENLKLAKSSSAALILRKILDESAFLPVIASKADGVQELANVEKLVKLTINLFSQGFKTLYDYAAFLRDAIEQSGDEAQAAISEESNAVVIMTLHQAKGLEFPAVFLYKCDDKQNRSDVKSKSVVVNKNLGLLTKVPVRGNYSGKYKAAPVIGINDLVARKKELAEIKRLLYVGVTRAKDFLFISTGAKKDNRFAGESFTGLIQEGLGIDLQDGGESTGSDIYSIESDLKFLKAKSGSFEYQTKKIRVDIPVINNVELVEKNPEVKPAGSIKKIKLQEIEEIQRGEIVSATKLSVYKQCPLKYYLTYDAGFAPLYKRYKYWVAENRGRMRYEFNESEDEKLATLREDASDEKRKEFSDVKGRIVHKILQLEVLSEQIESQVNELLRFELEYPGRNEKTVLTLKNEIVKDLKKFYMSSVFSELKKYLQYKNEFEIYSGQGDYFLYGIIDKLIIEGNRAIIVDYKTDAIDEKSLEEKIKSYSTQLEFYALLVSKLYPDIKVFELRLIFIMKPEKSYTKELDAGSLSLVKKDLDSMVSAVRHENFAKDLSHCGKCSFADNRGICAAGRNG